MPFFLAYLNHSNGCTKDFPLGYFIIFYDLDISEGNVDMQPLESSFILFILYFKQIIFFSTELDPAIC